MNFIEKLKKLIEKGFASKEEKKALVDELKSLSEDVQEIAAKQMEELKELPEKEKEENVEAEVKEAIKSIFKSEEKGIKESVKSEIVDEVQKILEEHKEKMSRGVGVYSEEVQKDVKRKVANKFLREGLLAVINQSDSKEFESARKEMTTDSTGTPYAGYITDEYLSAEIRHLITEYGVAAREFETITFKESSYKANNLATDVSGFWVDEAGSIKSTQVVLGQETLTLKKLATIITLTRELLQEQEIDFVSFIGSRVAEEFAQMEDEAFFIGDGTSTYGSFTGLLNNTSVNEVTLAAGDGAFADISVEKLRNMQDETPQGALANGKYYMNRSILSIIRDLREDAVSAGDKAGAFLYKAPIGKEPANIDGFPIVLVEAMPDRGDSAVSTSFVLFGDLKKTTIRGVRGGIIVDSFKGGTVRNVADNDDINLITTDREAVRWINQVGFIAIIPTAVTKLTTSSSSN
ncbi:MAG: phage major capsid protein [Candidatus Heimdallarchaeaceae archaeon]